MSDVNIRASGRAGTFDVFISSRRSGLGVASRDLVLLRKMAVVVGEDFVTGDDGALCDPFAAVPVTTIGRGKIGLVADTAFALRGPARDFCTMSDRREGSLTLPELRDAATGS